VDAVKYFFPEAKSIEEFWRMTTIAAYRNNREQDKTQVLDTAIHSFKQLIRKMKSSFVSKPIAYFYGILNKKLEELYFEDLLAMGFSTDNRQSYMGFFYIK
jgi:hypothetical protein